jgi:3-phytase
VHPRDATLSRVLGTNKKQGLLVYDLQGKQLQFLESGRLNNVDVRQAVRFDGQTFDVAVASQRDDNSIVLYGIDADGSVGELARFATGFPEIYGICLFQPRAGGLEVIANDKRGAFRQYRIVRTGDTWSAQLGREFKVASQPEGCVADDRNERLFIGEEKRGVWTLGARIDQPTGLTRVLGIGKDLRPDVEGMAIYHGTAASYLVVSSQGDSSYVVLDALAPYRVRGRFKVGFNLAAGIDGTSDTDGLDVTSRNLGGPYGNGMLVIQDGYKRMPDGTQNFKYVAWEDVALALKLPLEK